MYTIIESVLGWVPPEFEIVKVFVYLMVWFGIARVFLAPLEFLILFIRTKIRGR